MSSVLPGSTLYPSSYCRKVPAERNICKSQECQADQGHVHGVRARDYVAPAVHSDHRCSEKSSAARFLVQRTSWEQNAEYLWDKRDVLASEEQSLEQFLLAVISASREMTFAVAQVDRSHFFSQSLLLYLPSTTLLLIMLQEALFFVVLVLCRHSAW